MKLRSLLLICLLIGVAAGSACAQKMAADPVSGKWTGNWGPNERQRTTVVLELHFDGKTLTGAVNPGPVGIPLTKASFDPKTLAVHMECDATGPDGSTDHYVVDGKVDKNTMSGTWSRNNGKGDFKITRE